MIINVMSAVEAESASYKLTDRTAIISIRNPGENPVPFCKSGNLAAVRIISFADTSIAGPDSFSREHAHEILLFLQAVLGSVDRLIVHCEFGVSRSAGIAAAILKTLTGDDSAIFEDKWYVPNMLCYRYTYEALHDADGESLIGNMGCEFKENDFIERSIAYMDINELHQDNQTFFIQIGKDQQGNSFCINLNEHPSIIVGGEASDKIKGLLDGIEEQLLEGAKTMPAKVLRVKSPAEWEESFLEAAEALKQPGQSTVLMIDELADILEQFGYEAEEKIGELSFAGFDSGMYVILASAHPFADVITGYLKSQFPTRISFKVKDKIVSRIILDISGAEALKDGEALFYVKGSERPVKLTNAG